MENPTPFDLNEAIRRWQKDLGASPAFCSDNLEELESHLRDSVRRLKVYGLSEEEAFLTAVRRIGERGLLEREFAKVSSVTWSSPVILFCVVVAIYLYQVVYWLTFGILVWRHTSEMREVTRLVANGASVRQAFRTIGLHYHLGRSFLPEVSIVTVLVLILSARLTTGSWKKLSAPIKIFQHPIYATLGLAMLGLILPLSPYFVAAFQGMRVNASRLNPFVAYQAAVNVVLVLTMVLLARRGLRKTA